MGKVPFALQRASARMIVACACIAVLAFSLSGCSRSVIADSEGAVDANVVPVGNVRADSDGPVYVMTELVVYRTASLGNEDDYSSGSRRVASSSSASSSNSSASAASSASTSASIGSSSASVSSDSSPSASGSPAASSDSSASSSANAAPSAPSSAASASNAPIQDAESQHSSEVSASVRNADSAASEAPAAGEGVSAAKGLSDLVYGSAEFTVDAFGNPVSCRKQNLDPSLEGRVGSKFGQSAFAESTYEFDKAEWGLGYEESTTDYSQLLSIARSGSASSSSFGGVSTKRASFEIDGGKPISRMVDGDTAEFDYYAFGKMKMVSFPQSVTSSNVFSRSNEYCTFNEAGYPISARGFENGTGFMGNSVGADIRKYQWSFNEEGKPESVKVSRSVGSLPVAFEQSFTFEVDDAGNITKVFDRDGVLCARMAYKKIDNPSAWVRLYVAGVLQWC